MEHFHEFLVFTVTLIIINRRIFLSLSFAKRKKTPAALFLGIIQVAVVRGPNATPPQPSAGCGWNGTPGTF
jgi:hypothetical protein